jgi:hypothetical protein
MEKIREGCFGTAYDFDDEECKTCILKEECRKYYELAKNSSELNADTRDCFGKLYDPENRYCKICVLSEKCAQKSGKSEKEKSEKEVKKMEEIKKEEIKKEEEVKVEEVKKEGKVKKEEVEKKAKTKTPVAKVRREAVIVKIGAYELDLNHPRVRIHPAYEMRYHKFGNPWQGLAEEKRLWKGGRMFSGKYQVCYEWMRSVKEFSIQAAVEKFSDKVVRGVVKRTHPVGMVKYDPQRGVFRFINPGEKSDDLI